MPQVFLCYLHKRDLITPELRVVAARSRGDLPDMIAAELPTWGEFEVVHVYDDTDHRLFSFSESPAWLN